MPRRRLLGTALLAAASVSAGVLLCEAVVRIAGLAPRIDRVRLDDPASPFRMSENAVLGYEMRPGFRHQDADGIATNAFGLRGPDVSREKPAGVRRIAMLGDSVVMGLYIVDYAQTLPAQLEQRLGPDRAQVLNLGVKGYSTRAEVELLRVRGLALQPDLAIVVFLRNDHRNFNGDIAKGFAWSRPRWAEAAFLRSHLFRFAVLALDLFHFRAELDPEYDKGRHAAALEDDDNVEAGLRLLAALGREHGFRSLVAVWPEFVRGKIVDPHGLFEDESETRMKVETIAMQYQIPVVRLSPAFRADYARRRAAGETRNAQDLYTFDRMHPNPFGAAVAADILASMLRERVELLPGLGAPPAPQPQP